VKKGIHPENYRPVVFRDDSADVNYIIRSTVRTNKTITIDGQEYPLVMLDISAASHPFFTGKQKFVDTAGRVDRFNRRYGKKTTGAADKPAAKASK
jgi:large subunit ribosomal protein L31